MRGDIGCATQLGAVACNQNRYISPHGPWPRPGESFDILRYPSKVQPSDQHDTYVSNPIMVSTSHTLRSISHIMHKPQKKPDAAAAFQHVLMLPSSIAAQAALKEKRSYKCTHCSTTFRRSEHCIRHERSRGCSVCPSLELHKNIILQAAHNLSDTLEKPFGCGVCGCSFSRK